MGVVGIRVRECETMMRMIRERVPMARLRSWIRRVRREGGRRGNLDVIGRVRRSVLLGFVECHALKVNVIRCGRTAKYILRGHRR